VTAFLPVFILSFKFHDVKPNNQFFLMFLFLYSLCQKVYLLLHQDACAPGRLDAWLPAHRAAWTPGCLRTGPLGRLVACAPGRLDAWSPGCLPAWMPGRLDAWTPARLDACPPGRLPAWMPGRLVTPTPGEDMFAGSCPVTYFTTPKYKKP
jgi:hypothetical protein